MATSAIFLDKDGTLLIDIPHSVDPRIMRFHEGAPAAIREWHEAGHPLVVITNQPGVAHGFFAEEALQDVKRRLEVMFRECRSRLSGFYYCPHHPQGRVAAYTTTCECRKPAPGMLLRAASELEIDLESSWMIGDILNDVEAGNRAGCRTMLLDTGGETEWQPGALREPHFKVKNWCEAAEVMRREGVGRKGTP